MRRPVTDQTKVLESYIERKVCDYAKKLGWLVRKLSWVGHTGAPDRVFIRDGRLIFIEFKAWKKKPTANQAAEITRLLDNLMEVHIIDNIADGIALFDRYQVGRNHDDLI